LDPKPTSSHQGLRFNEEVGEHAVGTSSALPGHPEPPKSQTQMTTIAAAIDDCICTLIGLMGRIYISNFLDT
jgi:hypothetical protein